MAENNIPDIIENAVLILKSEQRADGEIDCTEANVLAGYSYQPDKAQISYYDTEEDGTRQGRTVITLLPKNVVTVRKEGFTEALMILELGKTHFARYQLAIGGVEMRLRICATKIEAKLNQNGGTLHLEYLLDVGDAFSARNMIDVNVSLRKEQTLNGKECCI